MLTFRRALGLTLPFIGMGVALACSPSTGGNHGIGNDSGGTSGAAGSSGGAGGSTGGSIGVGGSAATGGGVMLAGMGSGATSSAGSGGTDTCAAMFTPGMPVPVDVYVMLDISGSMLDPMEKWMAIKGALGSFFADPTSAGLNVAIQYFPQRVPGVPTSCTGDAECGAAGPCGLYTCQTTPQVFVTCTPNPADPADVAPCTGAIQRDDGPCMDKVCHLSGKTCAADADCQTIPGPLGKCVGFGVCDGNGFSCSGADPTINRGGCGADGGVGKCIDATTHYCAHETVCEPAAYQTPAVDYLTLPDTGALLNTSMAAQMPAGDTPSRPALRGAIAHARTWAAAHTGHSQVVLLATDGLPSDCTGGREISGDGFALALDDVVDVVTEGYTPKAPSDASVSTFVIGVFSETETTAQTNLDRIAKAGGSEHAFVISSGGDVQQQFLSALANIRKSRVSCEFLPPPPPAGQTLDWTMVNVTVTTDVGPKELVNVEPAACTGMTDEWHYDCNIRDKAEMCKPTKLIACPKTCEDLTKQAASGVTVGLGCAIKVR
jgi:hypothetical protein